MQNPSIIGIVGAGTMGAGVAVCFAQAGLKVALVDTDASALETANKRIREVLRQVRLLRPKTLTGGIEEIVSRIALHSQYDNLASADFLVENITENWQEKRATYEILDKVCGKQAIIAANTSTIPISQIAACTNRAEQVLGLHFMNPAAISPVVEMIRGAQTSDATMDTSRALLQRVGRDWIEVKDSAGFVTNRILMLAINEAILLVSEEAAKASDIDKILRSCFGHRMGLLETADLIGLDVVLHSLQLLEESFGEKYRPAPLLQEMVSRGQLGEKSQGGFYSYG